MATTTNNQLSTAPRMPNNSVATMTHQTTNFPSPPSRFQVPTNSVSVQAPTPPLPPPPPPPPPPQPQQANKAIQSEQDIYYGRLDNNLTQQDQTDILYEEKAIDVGPVDEPNENAYQELNNYQVLLNEHDFSSSSDSDCLFSELTSSHVDTLRNELMPHRANDKNVLNQYFNYFNDELTLADVDDDEEDEVAVEEEEALNDDEMLAKLADKSLNRSRQSIKSAQLRSVSSMNNQPNRPMSKQDSYNSIYFSFNKGQQDTFRSAAAKNNNTSINNNNNTTANVNSSYLRNFEEGLDFTPVKDDDAIVYNENNNNMTAIRVDRKRAILEAANAYKQQNDSYMEKNRLSTLMPPSFCLSPLKISNRSNNNQSMNNSTLTSDTDTSVHQAACCPLPLKKKW